MSRGVRGERPATTSVSDAIMLGPKNLLRENYQVFIVDRIDDFIGNLRRVHAGRYSGVHEVVDRVSSLV